MQSKNASGAGMLRFMRELSAEKSLQQMFFVSVDVEEDETEVSFTAVADMNMKSSGMMQCWSSEHGKALQIEDKS